MALAKADILGSSSSCLVIQFLFLAMTGFVPFFKNNFPELFQDFSRTQIDLSRALKFTLTPTLPRSQC